MDGNEGLRWRGSNSINLEPTRIYTGAMLELDNELQAKSWKNIRERLGKM